MSSKEISATKGPSIDDIMQMLKKAFNEETKEIREELMDWKVKCKELEKQNNILDYRVKGSTNKISELEKKLEESEDLKNSSMRKYYDLKRDFEELSKFKESITHMVSPSKEKGAFSIDNNTGPVRPTINPAIVPSVSSNLSISKFSSPDIRKTNPIISDFSIDSISFTPTHDNHRDFEPIMTTSQQRTKYGSDSPIIFHSKTPQKNRDQPIRSRSATLATRKRTSILKDPASFSREKNVKFSPSTKGADEDREFDSLNAPPTPHSSFGVQYTKKTEMKEEPERASVERVVSTPSRRANTETISSSTRTSRLMNSADSAEDDIGNDLSAQELYLKVKKALSPEEFKNFSSNIRKLNMGEQSITTTLVNLRETIGEERNSLYKQLKRVISSGEM